MSFAGGAADTAVSATAGAMGLSRPAVGLADPLARGAPGRRGGDGALTRITRQIGPAERRQVTVLFCDIVDSSGLAARMDPEDVTRLLVGYRRDVDDVVRRHGGYVARYIGDGILAYWGYPVSQVDDARLAVSAGLEIISALDGRINVRCGLDAGIVVVGRIGDAETGELEVVGRAPNSAAHLQAIAPGNTVVVSDTVRALTRDAVDYAPLDLPAGSKLGRVSAWRALRPRPGWQRSTRSKRPITGRAEECARLEAAVDDAVRGTPRVVLIRGEDGIGKSMLVNHAIEHAMTREVEVLEVECRPEHRCVTLRAARELVRNLVLRVAEQGTQASTASTLSRMADGDEHDTALLDQFLQPALGRVDPPASVPQAPGRLVRLILAMLARRTAERPVMVVIEDIHFADEATLQLLVEATTAFEPGHHIALLVTTRAKPARGSALQRTATEIVLRRLPNDAIDRLLSEQCLPAPIEPGARTLIVTRAEGHPLIAIELARLAAEPQGRRSLTSLLAAPSPLNSILANRLDRLGPLKALAQAAAVLGRQFDARILAEVVEVEPRVLKQQLGRLVGHGIIAAADPRVPGLYRFSHALDRDAAHASILRENRRTLHRRAAKVLTQQFPDAADADPEAVATHATACGDAAMAFPWWRLAAMHAIRISATPAAIRHLERALAVRLVEQSPASVADEIDLLRHLGLELSKLKGNATPEVRATYQRALELAAAGDAAGKALLFDLTCGQHGCLLAVADMTGAAASASRLLGLAQETGDPALLANAHRKRGTLALLTGEIEVAIADFGLARGLNQGGAGDMAAVASAAAQEALALGYEALACAISGATVQSERPAAAALALAERLRNPHTSAHVAGVLAVRSQIIGDRAGAVRLTAKARGLAERFGYPHWATIAGVIDGWLEGAHNPDRAVERISADIDRCRDHGDEQALPYARLLLAETLIRAGRPVAANAIASEALRHAECRGLCLFRSELLRVAAAAARTSGDAGAARRLLDAAGAVARRQGARLFEGRAHADAAGSTPPCICSSAA